METVSWIISRKLRSIMLQQNAELDKEEPNLDKVERNAIHFEALLDGMDRIQCIKILYLSHLDKKINS